MDKRKIDWWAGEGSAPVVAPSELIIAIGGQSNAGVRGSVSGLTGSYATYAGVYSNVYYIDNGVTYTTRQAYDRDSGSDAIGAEIGIVSQLHTAVDMEIIKWSQGSRAIKDQSRPNNFYPYSASEGLFTTAFYKNDGTSFWQTNLTAISETKPNVIIWIQGEEDAVLTSTTYLADLTAFVAAIRNGYNDQTIPFFYLQLHADFYEIAGVPQYEQGRTNIRAAQDAFQSSKNIMINMDDVVMGDTDGVNVHYGSDALAEIGKRFSTAIKTYYNITLPQFTFTSAATNDAGTYLDITCSRNIVSGDSGITLYVGGVSKTFTYSVVSNKLRITPTVAFVNADVITLASTSSNVSANDGATLADFTVSTGVVTNNVPPAEINLAPTTVGMSYNAGSNTYTGTGAGFACYGQDTTNTISTNGEIRMDRYTNAGGSNAIGIDGDTTNGNYTTWDYAAFQTNATTLACYKSNVLKQGSINISSYSRIRLKKTGTVMTCSGLNGSTWTVLHTFADANNSATSYGKISTYNGLQNVNPTIVLG